MNILKLCLSLALCVCVTPTLAAPGPSPAMTDPLALNSRVIEVRFRQGTSPELIRKISNAFRSPATRLKDMTYRFQVPALRTQNQYAELFAALPSVEATVPTPAYQVADHINPQVNVVQAAPQGAGTRTQNFLPGEVLVKYKAGVSKADIAFLNGHMDARLLSQISGIDVYRLALPRNMTVEEAVKRYQASPLVEFAEPNYTLSLPTPVDAGENPAPPLGNAAQGPLVMTPVPLDGGRQMLIHFRPGSSKAVVDKFHLIYGTRPVKKTSFYSYRVQLPPGLNAGAAVRVFKLYPGVSDVQRLYS